MKDTINVEKFMKNIKDDILLESKKDLIKIAIDPDLYNTGLAICCYGMLHLYNFEIDELFDELKELNNECELHVFIEASWLISYNYTSSSKNVNLATKLKIANHTGENHAAGKIIESFCKKNKIKYYLVNPLRKIWGKDGRQKISHKEFEGLNFGEEIMFKVPSKTNQEQRDAALILLSRMTTKL